MNHESVRVEREKAKGQSKREPVGKRESRRSRCRDVGKRSGRGRGGGARGGLCRSKLRVTREGWLLLGGVGRNAFRSVAFFLKYCVAVGKCR